MRTQWTWVPGIVVSLLFSAAAMAAAPVEEALKSAKATFEPATAQPGQTVTLKITVELAEGWSTYPTEQPDKKAISFRNRITFPEEKNVAIVGELKQPPEPKTKSEPLLGIKEMHFYPGGGVWEAKAKVSEFAAPGKVKVPVNFRLLICDKDNCLPPKRLTLEPELTIQGK